MTAVPIALPGPAPLPGAQTLPGTLPTPHDPAAADPFLALLSQLVVTTGTPVPAEETPIGDTDLDTGLETGAESEAGDRPADPEAGPVPPGLPGMPVLPVLAAFVPAAGPAPTVLPSPTPAHETPIPGAETGGPTAEAPAPAPDAVAAPPAPAAQPAQATVPVTAAAPATPATGAVATPGGADAPAPVTRQVFPEVVRAVVTGDTPRRVVVRLEPEHLGEVRVVLRTDRTGALEVSIAGGQEARAAIREGAPELRRLLEAAGSHDARVVVRHLTESAPASGPTPVAATTTTAPTTPTRTDAPTTAGDLPVDVGAGTAGGTAHGEERRGRTPQDARPGATDGIPDRTVETSRPAIRRAGGLDVMM